MYFYLKLSSMLYHQVIGQGKAIVLLHGFMENSRIWNDFVLHFSKTHQLIMIDLPGHGKSRQIDEINYMESLADNIVGILRFLEIKKASFIGHSMGGYVSLAIGEIYPQLVEKIILVNSTSLPDSYEKREQRLKVIPTVQRNFPLFVRLSIPMLFNDEEKSNLQEEMNYLKEIALETSIEGIEASLKGMRDRPDRTFVLYDLDIPILVINGTKDRTINVDLFETVIPEKANIKIVRLDCGHVAFLEKKKQFIDTVTMFI